MKKVPRIMVVLTKLDLVDEKQRLSVVESVQRKLEAMETEIPLYLSAENMVEGWGRSLWDRSNPETDSCMAA